MVCETHTTSTYRELNVNTEETDPILQKIPVENSNDTLANCFWQKMSLSTLLAQ